MTTYKETYNDYNIKYRDTFLVWNCKADEKRYPIRISEFHPTGASKVKFAAKAKIYPKYPKDPYYGDIQVEEIDYRFLPRGCINLSSSVFVLNEISPQGGEGRYRAALNLHNTAVIDPFKYERQMIHSIPLEFDNNTILHALINNKYESAQTCLKNVCEFKRLGQAFCEDYFFGIKFAPNSVMLFRRDRMVGRVNRSNGKVLLKPTAHPLFEELSEFGLDVEKIAK